MDSSTFVHRDLSFAAVVEVLAAVDLEVGEPRDATHTLLDTFDGRLHAAQMTLQANQTAQPGRLRTRLQLQLRQHGSLPATVTAERLPRLAADLPSGPLGNRVRAAIDVRALLPLVRFDTHSVAAVLRDAGGRPAATVVACDAVEVEPGMRVPPTVTVTASPGQDKRADRIAEHLLANGFEQSDHDLIDLVTVAAGVDRNGVSRSATVPLERDTPAAEAFQAVLLNLLDTIEDNCPGTIADLDTEFLHDLRVAVRRTRSIIGQAKRVLPESTRARYRDEFAWLAGTTGPTRDLDAYALEWPRYVAEFSGIDADALQPVLDHIVRHRHEAHAELVAVLRSERAITLLADWRVALAIEPAVPPSQAREDVGRALAKRFRQAHHAVVHQGRQIDEESPAEHLHDLRKDAKKLRYLVECFASVMPDKPRRRFVKRLKELQDNLGRHQDAEVHADELHRVGSELTDADGRAEDGPRVGPETLVALGALAERLEQSKRQARAEFAPCFAAYDSPRTDRIVTEILEALES